MHFCIWKFSQDDSGIIQDILYESYGPLLFVESAYVDLQTMYFRGNLITYATYLDVETAILHRISIEVLLP